MKTYKFTVITNNNKKISAITQANNKQEVIENANKLFNNCHIFEKSIKVVNI